MIIVGWIVSALVKRNMPTGWAHIIAWAVTILGALAILWGGWSLLKATIIRDHDAKQQVEILTKTRQADEKAAASRQTTTAIIANDQQEIANALAPLPDAPLTPRQHARGCAVLVQQARKAGRPIPAGCGSDAKP